MNIRPRTRDEVLAELRALPPEHFAQISPDWLAKLEKSAQQDPWFHGFHVIDDDGAVVGQASFKGPPADGLVWRFELSQARD